MAEHCELCAFRNPKITATGIAIRDQKILVLKRNDEPFKGMWDFPGGYLNEGETPEITLKREMKEELGVDVRATLIDCFSGTASYKDKEYPILSFTYLMDFTGDIQLDKQENSEFAWVPLSELNDIAFDSNQKILAHLKKTFLLDLDSIKELIRQLDSTAVFDEQRLYRAMIGGYYHMIKDGTKVQGMGWAFNRETMLRTQAVVEDMIVDEKHRGKGWGEEILKQLFAIAEKNNVEMMELTTNPARVAANSLYQKLGFQLHKTNHYLRKMK